MMRLWWRLLNGLNASSTLYPILRQRKAPSKVIIFVISEASIDVYTMILVPRCFGLARSACSFPHHACVVPRLSGPKSAQSGVYNMALLKVSQSSSSLGWNAEELETQMKYKRPSRTGSSEPCCFVRVLHPGLRGVSLAGPRCETRRISSVADAEEEEVMDLQRVSPPFPCFRFAVSSSSTTSATFSSTPAALGRRPSNRKNNLKGIMFRPPLTCRRNPHTCRARSPYLN